MDFISFDNSETSPRALMPCGHAIGSDSMLEYLNNTIQKNQEYKIHCDAIKSNNYKDKCNAEWPFRLSKIIANLSKSEGIKIDNGFAQLYSKNRNKSEDCPQCQTPIVREDKDQSIMKVECPMCTKNGKK